MKLNILPKKIPGDASADADEEDEDAEGLAPTPFLEFLIASVNKRNLQKQNLKVFLSFFSLLIKQFKITLSDCDETSNNQNTKITFINIL
jgi:hypothetical protein